MNATTTLALASLSLLGILNCSNPDSAHRHGESQSGHSHAEHSHADPSHAAMHHDHQAIAPAATTPSTPSSTALNNCAPEAFVDRTADNADRMIHFHGPRYSTRCITIHPGQAVGFMGDMAQYNLAPGPAAGHNGTTAFSAISPIPNARSGELISVRFATPGIYPFHAPGFESRGMMGVIRVQ